MGVQGGHIGKGYSSVVGIAIHMCYGFIEPYIDYNTSVVGVVTYPHPSTCNRFVNKVY